MKRTIIDLTGDDDENGNLVGSSSTTTKSLAGPAAAHHYDPDCYIVSVTKRSRTDHSLVAEGPVVIDLTLDDDDDNDDDEVVAGGPSVTVRDDAETESVDLEADSDGEDEEEEEEDEDDGERVWDDDNDRDLTVWPMPRQLKAPLTKNSKAVLADALAAVGQYGAASPRATIREKVEALTSFLAFCRLVENKGCVFVGMDPGLINFGWAIFAILPNGDRVFCDAGCNKVISGTTADNDSVVMSTQINHFIAMVVERIPVQLKSLPIRFLVEKQFPKPAYNFVAKKFAPPSKKLRQVMEVQHVVVTVLDTRLKGSVETANPLHVSKYWKTRYGQHLLNVKASREDQKAKRRQYNAKKENAVTLMEILGASGTIQRFDGKNSKNHHICDASLIAIACMDWVQAGQAIEY